MKLSGGDETGRVQLTSRLQPQHSLESQATMAKRRLEAVQQASLEQPTHSSPMRLGGALKESSEKDSTRQLQQLTRMSPPPSRPLLPPPP